MPAIEFWWECVEEGRNSQIHAGKEGCMKDSIWHEQKTGHHTRIHVHQIL